MCFQNWRGIVLSCLVYWRFHIRIWRFFLNPQFGWVNRILISPSLLLLRLLLSQNKCNICESPPETRIVQIPVVNPKYHSILIRKKASSSALWKRVMSLFDYFSCHETAKEVVLGSGTPSRPPPRPWWCPRWMNAATCLHVPSILPISNTLRSILLVFDQSLSGCSLSLPTQMPYPTPNAKYWYH